MRYFPISYDTKDKTALLLGGGPSALKQLESLWDLDFTFYAIGEEFLPEFKVKSLENPRKLQIKSVPLIEDFPFMGYDFIIIATEDENLNAAFEKRANSRKLPYITISGSSALRPLPYKNYSSYALAIVMEENSTDISEILLEELDGSAKEISKEKISILQNIREALERSGQENISKIIKDLWDKEAFVLEDYLKNVDTENE